MRLHARREVALWSRSLCSGNNCSLFAWKRTLECIKCCHANDENDYIALSLRFKRRTPVWSHWLWCSKRPDRHNLSRCVVFGSLFDSTATTLLMNETLLWSTQPSRRYRDTLTSRTAVNQTAGDKKSACRHRHIKDNLFSYMACCSPL